MFKICKKIDTDVLIVGGGIAGLMAAIAAAEQKVDVLVAEKANTRRSGSGARATTISCVSTRTFRRSI
jgi:succinate dehydrogenase/fumarate reductase flavoprotein subunit